MPNDRIAADDQTNASVVHGPNRATFDTLALHGHFDVVCTAPVDPTQIDEYLGLMRELAEAETRGDAAAIAAVQSRLPLIPMQVKWRETIDNLVTTVGKNDLLDKYLLGSAYTQTFRMGLKGTGTAVVGDTQASHAGWLEQGLANAPTYTGNRKSVTMGAAAAGVSTSPTQSFAITSTGTVFGCFTNNGGSATIDSTTGVLFSAGDFSGGSKAVTSGDTIQAVYSLSV
jgi:hypothetical protein